MARNFDIKKVTTAYVVASGTSLTTATVAGLLWRHWGGEADIITWAGISWSAFVGLPSVALATDYLREALGQKRPTTINISANTSGGDVSGGRQIPVNHNGRTTNIFASMLPAIADTIAPRNPAPAPMPAPPAPVLPHSFIVEVAGNGYTLPVSTVDDFLRAAWRRQRNGKAGLARRYHIEDRRPRMAETDYKAMIYLLISANGLVVDRGERRSGKLSLPPAAALAHLQTIYSAG